MEKKRIFSLFIAPMVIVGGLVLGITIILSQTEIDTTAPIVEITGPTNTTYHFAQQLLQIKASDNMTIDTIWYNWDGNNVTYHGPHDVAFNEGVNTIHAWAKDSAGNIGSTSVVFTMSFNNFTTLWNTTKISPYSGTNNQVKLPLEYSGKYDFTVDWGDETYDTIKSYNQPEVTHTYALQGVYTVNIKGNLIGWSFNDEGDKLKLLDIKQWGVLQLGNLGSYFRGCSNLNVTASDILDLTRTTSLNAAFLDCRKISKIDGLDRWKVSRVTKMGSLFYGASLFNQDINNWDVSSVTDMWGVFNRAPAFNQSLSNWDVSSVTGMSAMFFNATSFNQNLSNWDVSRVSDMSAMFCRATFFNQNINNWDVSRVTDMRSMFDEAMSFNQSLSNWNVSRVTNMVNMFKGAPSFNQNIGNWNVSSVTDMNSMFYDASFFNQDISNWHVSSVTYMGGMFFNASSFNQNIGNWNVLSVTNMWGMFLHVTLSTSNYDSLLIGWSQLVLQEGVSFYGGNSQYSSDTAADARQSIIDNFSWVITDGGEV